MTELESHPVLPALQPTSALPREPTPQHRLMETAISDRQQACACLTEKAEDKQCSSTLQVHHNLQPQPRSHTPHATTTVHTQSLRLTTHRGGHWPEGGSMPGGLSLMSPTDQVLTSNDCLHLSDPSFLVPMVELII